MEITMSHCLADHALQAIVDGEASAEALRHASECAECGRRLEARRRATDRVIAAAGSAALPPPAREAVRARLTGTPPIGATTLRPVGASRRWVWSGALATAAALLLIFVILPGVDRRTTVSASEILGRSRTALGAPVTGIEVLSYDLELTGVLGDLIPAEQTGRFTVEETIDHDHDGRYRIVKLAPDGRIVGGAADDPIRQTRVRYLRADGNGYLFRFAGAQSAALSVPALKRAALQAFISLMQTSGGQTMTEVERDGEPCYRIDVQETPVPAGSLLALSRATATVTVAESRLVEFSATGSMADRPFSIVFSLRSRELRDASGSRGAEFDIPAQPGDVVLEGAITIATSNPMWEVVARALGSIPPSRGPVR